MKTKILAVLALAACLAIPASTEQGGDYVSIRFEFSPGAVYTVHPKIPDALCVLVPTGEGEAVAQCSTVPARLSLGDPV